MSSTKAAMTEDAAAIVAEGRLTLLLVDSSLENDGQYFLLRVRARTVDRDGEQNAVNYFHRTAAWACSCDRWAANPEDGSRRRCQHIAAAALVVAREAGDKA